MDRRLSVNRASSKISKPSSRSPFPSSGAAASSSSSSRPPTTVVDADPSSFRRVVQELTGTPPPSASSSPTRLTTDSIAGRPNSTRLQRIAPPPLRQTLAQQQQQRPQAAATIQPNQYSLQQYQHQHQQFHLPQQQQVPNHLLHHQRHPQYLQDNIQGQHAPMVGPFPPPLPLTQRAYPNPNFNPNPSLLGYPNASLPMLSPHLLSPLPVLSPGDNTWANPLDAIPSPRPLFNPTNPLAPLLTLPSPGSRHEGRANSRGDHAEVLERAPSLSLPSPHAGQQPPPLPSAAASWYPQSQYPPLLPSPAMAPSPAGFSWLPWSPLGSPPPFSPSLFLPSPGVAPSPGGFSFRGPSDYSSKPS